MKKHFSNLLYEIRQNRPFTSILLLLFVVVVVFSHYIVAEDTTTVLNSYSGTGTYSTTTNSLYNTTTSTSTISGTSSGGSGSSSGDSTSSSGTSTSGTINTTTSDASTSGSSSLTTETSGISTTTPTTTTVQTEETTTTTTSNTETVPEKSLGLTATPGSCGSGRIYIFWYPSSNVAGYVLYRDNLQVYKGLDTSFLDTGLMADKSYSYKLYLFNSYGLSSGISLGAKSPKNCETTTTVTSPTTTYPTSTITPTTTTTITPTTTTTIPTNEDSGETETEIDKETDDVKPTTENTITSGESEEDSEEDEDTPSEISGDLSDLLEPENRELLYKDSNEDGISDYDSVNVYNIDPIAPSPTSTYEGRNITASEKILLGFDPTQSELVKVVPEEPELSDAPVLEIYEIKEVALNEDNKVIFKGTALPNSFVTLYIYSTPIIVTVKTDNDGEWQYTLDEELENGQHTVYTATVNNTGKIVARSSDSLFTKTAEAATLDSIPFLDTSVDVEEPGLFEGNNLYVLIISIVAVLVGFFILIGSLTKKKVDQNPPSPAS